MGPASTGVLRGNALFLTWLLVFGSVLVAWGLAATAIGPGPESRARRSAIPVGSATLIAAFSVAIARLIAAVEEVPDPLAHFRKVPFGGARPTSYDVLVFLALAHAVLFPLWTL